MTSRRRSALLFSTAALVLAACGGGSDTVESESEPAPAETEPAPVETESAPVETEPVAVESDPAPADTEPAPVETDPAPVDTDPAPVDTDPAPVDTDPAPVDTEPAPEEPEAPGTDSACLVGDWQILADDINGWYDQIENSLAAAGGPAPEFTIAGDLFLSLTPTDYVYNANFTLDLNIGGQGGSGAVTGEVTGAWEAVDGIITTTLEESNLNLQITVAGVTLDGSDLGNGLLDSVPINNAPFDCDGPTLGFQVDPADTVRHPVLLTPA